MPLPLRLVLGAAHAMPTRVVCLGGGYAAVAVARALRAGIRRGEFDVTIVSRDNFHVYHGFVHEMLCAKVQPSQIISPARRIFPPAKFHNAEIEKIDLAARTVTTSRLLDGRQYELPFDHLILALGSIDDLSRYAGTAEHSQKLKTYWDCFKARSHILSMLEMAEIEEDPVERRRLLTFVIAGGNFGGIEVATELQEYLQALARREYARIRAEEIRIVVIHSGDRILPELLQHHEPLVAWAERHLAGSGIDIRLKTRVEAATPEAVVLATGERIPARTIISCAGTAQSPCSTHRTCRVTKAAGSRWTNSCAFPDTLASGPAVTARPCLIRRAELAHRWGFLRALPGVRSPRTSSARSKVARSSPIASPASAMPVRLGDAAPWRKSEVSASPASPPGCCGG